MIPRLLEPVLRRAAATYPVVTLTGPRQSGKTTLLKAVFPEHNHVSLEDLDIRAFAREDPRGFLNSFPPPVLFDEAQRVPDLFSYLQSRVDEQPVPGQYLLSGSQNFLLLASVSQSLAGRCAILHLHPFTLAELAGRPPLDLSTIGQNLPTACEASWQTDVMTTVHTGFYPRIHDQRLEPQEWLRYYTQTYLERDVRSMVTVGDLAAFERFLRLCAGRVGSLLNLSSLAMDAGVSHTTARRWLSLLETSFITLLLRPHHGNFNKRLIKSPKLYFLDTGLLCYLLRIRSPEDLAFHASRGAVFESFVVAEFYKNAAHRGLEAPFHFWRDAAGHEVDLLIETDNSTVPLEIKSGQTLSSDSFTGLEYWRTLTGKPDRPAALVYAGDQIAQRRNTILYPWHCL